MNEVVYMINKGILKSNIEKYRKYASICLPIKSLCNDGLLSFIDTDGCSFLLDSGAQIEFINSLRIDKDLCVFGTTKSYFDLKDAIKNGISRFVISSKEEFDFIFNNAKIVNGITIMVNASSMIEDSLFDRFGVAYNELVELIEYVKKYANLESLSFHIQGNQKNKEHYVEIYDKLVSILHKYNIPALNLGGIPFKVLIEVIEKIPLYSDIKLIVEPGNSLFNDAISIKSYVCYVNTKSKTINLNIGIYNGLLDILLYDNKIELIAEKIVKIWLNIKFMDHLQIV